ncbi:MAG: Rpn family recombination-promoting nuclease/putative transposase [Alphaproteobacteria bacterium]|nr:Rpn family recombination-promoting nuclease/putative transposase [Alphaproteobacteria bacterium]
MTRVIQRHDQFFQRLLGKPGTAGALLRERLPAEVAKLLVDEPPELMPGSFVSRRLRGYRTDRLYRSRTITGRQVLIYTLIEHKSNPEPRISLHLLGYQYQALDYWDRTEGRTQEGILRPLPALITLVVYNGAAEWKIPQTLAEVTDADPAMRPYLLDFRYSLVDLVRIPDADLSRERNLRVGLLILKHGSLRRATRKQLLKLAREAMRLGEDDLVTLIYYLLGDQDGPKSALVRDVLHEVLPGKEDRVMSLAAEQWKSEGFSLGRTQGKAEGKADTLLRQLRRRFKSLPIETEGRVRAAGSDQLDEWLDRFVDAQTLDDVFGPDLTH